jgi:hypothetical protein
MRKTAADKHLLGPRPRQFLPRVLVHTQKEKTGAEVGPITVVESENWISLKNLK